MRKHNLFKAKADHLKYSFDFEGVNFLNLGVVTCKEDANHYSS